jgi:WD40 repeat protein
MEAAIVRSRGLLAMRHHGVVPDAGPQAGDLSPARCRVGRPNPRRWRLGRIALILGVAVGLPWFPALNPAPRSLPMHRAPGYPGAMIRGFAFSPDGQTIAMTDHLGSVTLRRASRGCGVERTLHSKGKTVAFSPDRRHLAIGGRETDVILCDLGEGGQERPLGIPVRAASDLSFSPDGRTLAVSSHASREIILWDLDNGRQRMTLRGHQCTVIQVTFSPDGRSLASASGASEERSVLIWNLATGRPERRLAESNSGFLCIAYSPDGRLLASACANEKPVRIWDVRTGRQVRLIIGHQFPTKALAFSPDGRLLATGAGDGFASVWSVATGRELRRLDGQVDLLRHILFAPDGSTLAATGSDGDIRFWDLHELIAEPAES